MTEHRHDGEKYTNRIIMKEQIDRLNEALAFLKDHFGMLEELNTVIEATDKRYGIHDGREVLVGDDFYEIASGHPRAQYELDDYHCFFLKTSERTEKLFVF